MPIDGAKAQGGTNNAKITYNYSASRTGHTTSDNSLLIINGIKITPGSTFYTYNSTGKYKTTGTSSGYTYAKIGNQYVNMNGWQCCAYARYVQYLLYGTQDSTGKKFKKIAQDQTATSASIEVWVKQAGVGAHIRSTRPHSFIVIGYDNNGFYYTDANVAGTNMVRVGYYTWKDFANCKYKNISYISYYVN